MWVLQILRVNRFACACVCLRGVETGVAFARSYVAGVETAITFAGEIRVFLVRFFGRSGDGGFNSCCSGARSGDGGFMPACISGCSGCSGVIICKVATGGVLRVKKFAQHGLIVGVSVKEFALRARNTPNLIVLRLLGELCHGLSGGEGVPGELCRACRPATVPGTVPAPPPPAGRPPSPE